MFVHVRGATAPLAWEILNQVNNPKPCFSDTDTMHQCRRRLNVHAGYFEADGSQTSHNNECQKSFTRNQHVG